MTAANPAYTPIASSKTAALSRVLDCVPKGYTHYTSGTCAAVKAEKLARKFHELYGIGCSPAQRITRKKHGLANALLVMYWPVGPAAEEEADALPAEATAQLLPRVEVIWLLLATEGGGPIHQQEQLRSVLESPRLAWLGYELVRHSSRGKATWTWRRPKSDMADLYAVMGTQLRLGQDGALAQTLTRISRQPGFAGVREQSWALFQFVRGKGYAKELPFLFFLQKVSHGVPLRVSPC